MIPLATTERERIDDAVAAAFAALDRRMRDGPASSRALSDAMSRACAGGRRLRPALVLRAFAALGGIVRDTPEVLQVAAAFELLHTAFVIHDDLIDGDVVRRGAPTIAEEFRLGALADGADAAGARTVGDAAALLAGDLFLHEAQRVVAIVETDPATKRLLLDLLDEAVIVSAAGELADVEQATFGSSGVSETMTMSRDKTAAYSFSAPLRAGAALAGADPVTLARLDRCGTSLGLAFQLVDDLIGTFGTTAEAGRPAGGDLLAAKHTPLIAYARSTSTWPEVDAALALAHTGPDALRDAQRALDGCGARSRAEGWVHDLLDEVRADGADLPRELGALLGECADGIARRIP